MQFLDPRLPMRFWNRVIPEPNSSCWLWIGPLTPKGYGNAKATIAGRVVQLAHRIALSVVAVLDPDLVVDHTCEVECCVNPAHMQQVTSIRNIELRRERSNRCARGHEYTPENTKWRKRGKYDERYCIACSRSRAKAQKNKQKEERMARHR